MQQLLPGNAMSITHSAPIEHDSSVQNMPATMTARQTRTRTRRAKLLASSSTPTCPACNETFSVPKSLARHLRTVHQRKSYSCPDCDIKFMRKDTLDRHIQHTHNATKKQCSSCGRWVSPRAFEEHLNSLVCRRSRTATRNTCSDERRLGVPGAEDDPFLITLQMTSLVQVTFIVLGPFHFLGVPPRPRDSRAREPPWQWYLLNLRALELVNEQIAAYRRVPSRIAALACAVSLLGGMCAGLGDQAGLHSHGRGLSALLNAHHSLTCRCKGYYPFCRSWRNSISVDAASALMPNSVKLRAAIGRYSTHDKITSWNFVPYNYWLPPSSI